MADSKITGLTENTSPLVTDLAVMVDDPGGTPLTQKITLANLLFAIARFKVGYITRDETAANGTVAITGVGFQPKAIAFIANVPNTDRYSWGFYDASGYATIMRFSTTSSSASTTECVYIGDGASWSQIASISALGSDGFTLSWTKNGSPPAGTINIMYLAIR